MSINPLIVFGMLPQLLLDGGALEHDIEGAIKDPAIKHEVSLSAVVNLAFKDAAKELTSVNLDLAAVKKAHFWNAIPRCVKLLSDLGLLVSEIQKDSHSLSIQAALKTMPHLAAYIEQTKPHWQAFQKDLQAVGVKI